MSFNLTEPSLFNHLLTLQVEIFLFPRLRTKTLSEEDILEELKSPDKNMEILTEVEENCVSRLRKRKASAIDQIPKIADAYKTACGDKILKSMKSKLNPSKKVKSKPEESARSQITATETENQLGSVRKTATSEVEHDDNERVYQTILLNCTSNSFPEEEYSGGTSGMVSASNGVLPPKPPDQLVTEKRHKISQSKRSICIGGNPSHNDSNEMAIDNEEYTPSIQDEAKDIKLGRTRRKLAFPGMLPSDEALKSFEDEKFLKMEMLLLEGDDSDIDQNYEIPSKNGCDSETDTESDSNEEVTNEKLECEKMEHVEMSIGESKEAEHFKNKYGICDPTPKKRKIALGNENFFKLLSALIHEVKFEKGMVLDGKPITVTDMKEAIEKGRRMKLLKVNLDPGRALYRYLKNMSKINSWFRGDPKTGYETLLDGRKVHSSSSTYCPFEHCHIEKAEGLGSSGLASTVVQFSPEEEGSGPQNELEESLEEDSSEEGLRDRELLGNYSRIELQNYIKVLEAKLKMKDEEIAVHEQKLRSLKSNENTEFNPWQCLVCSKTFGRGSHLKRHYTTLHPNKEFTIDNKKVPCKFCSMKVAPSNLARHRKGKYCIQNRTDEPKQKPMTREQLSPAQVSKQKKDPRFDFCPHCSIFLRLDSHKCKYQTNLATPSKNRMPKETPLKEAAIQSDRPTALKSSKGSNEKSQGNTEESPTIESVGIAIAEGEVAVEEDTEKSFDYHPSSKEMGIVPSPGNQLNEPIPTIVDDFLLTGSNAKGSHESNKTKKCLDPSKENSDVEDLKFLEYSKLDKAVTEAKKYYKLDGTDAIKLKEILKELISLDNTFEEEVKEFNFAEDFFINKEKNARFRENLKLSLERYQNAPERIKCFTELQAMYRRVKESANFCPSEEFYSATVEFIVTELLGSEANLTPEGELINKLDMHESPQNKEHE